MNAFRAIAALLAIAAVGAQCVQEYQRLTVVKRLEGRRALDYYEAKRKGSDRVIIFITAVVALGALVAIGFEVVYHL